jgi:hypothetical protein
VVKALHPVQAMLQREINPVRYSTDDSGAIWQAAM